MRGTSVLCAVEVAEPLGTVEVDLGQIAQVIQNLVLNACQASPSGATIFVRARRDEAGPEGARVVIEVSDQGCGIEPEHLSRIFEPFYSARPNGTGLGLAVSHSVVHRHGGQLSVESELGQGTTFTVVLPVARGLVAVAPGPSGSLARFSGRALVMDDDDQVRRIARRLLMRLGFDVDTSSHGAEALDMGRRAAAEGHPYRVALLDLTVVGGLGGFEVAEELRSASPGIRLVAASGYVAQGRQGWDAQLQKPYRLLELSCTLKEVFGHTAPRRSQGASRAGSDPA